MHGSTLRHLVVIAITLLTTIPGSLFAQGTDLGTLRGTVTDASGAVVPNATVAVTAQSPPITTGRGKQLP
jgi:hypothetical protein